MSTATGKLSPTEFLAELQRDIERLRGKGPVAAASTVTATTTADTSDLTESTADQSATDTLLPTSEPELLDAELPEAESTKSEPSDAESSEPAAASRPSTQLSGLLDRVNNLLGPAAKASDGPFVPQSPDSLASAGLLYEDVERIILKYLLSKGSAIGRNIAAQTCLNFVIIEPILKSLKNEQLVVFKSSAAMGDYDYSLTDNGRDRARRYVAECSYYGSATVNLKDYLNAMAAQSIAKQHATEADLKRAFSDLIINERMLDRLVGSPGTELEFAL